MAKPWPKSYDAPRAEWRAAESASGFAYRTNSYLILCREELGAGRVNEIATTAESVHEALSLFPLALLPTGVEGDDRRPARRTPIVRILATQKNYIASGGMPGTVGFFDGHTGEVLVSLEKLVEPKGPRSNLAPRQRYRLLVHELVHQAMGGRLGELPLWFTEGIAEYLAAVQFAPGRYKFENSSRAIIDHLYTVWAHDRRKTITVPSLTTLTAIGHNSWAADNEKNKANAYAKYAGSMLFVHFQLELASRGRGGLAEFLSTKPKRVPIPGERRRARIIPVDPTPLWNGHHPTTLQSKMTSYWKSKGLDLRFAPMR
jgi:hypothetical protein